MQLSLCKNQAYMGTKPLNLRGSNFSSAKVVDDVIVATDIVRQLAVVCGELVILKQSSAVLETSGNCLVILTSVEVLDFHGVNIFRIMFLKISDVRGHVSRLILLFLFWHEVRMSLLRFQVV